MQQSVNVFLTLQMEKEVDKEAIQQRISMINLEMKQLQTNYSKLEGHLQECNHWLAEILKKESADETLPTMDAKEAESGDANDQKKEQAA